MAKDKKATSTGKQFTNREIILLIILAFAAIIYAFYNFILLPTMDEIAILETETGTLQVELDSKKSLIAENASLQKKVDENTVFVDAYKTKYFSTINQEHFIKVLELDILDDNLEVQSLSFSENTPSAEFISEEGQEPLLQSSVISFPFSGTYESFMDLLRRIEQFNQLIRINTLDVTYQAMPESQYSTSSQWYQSGYNEIPLYQGNISIELFSIPQEYQSPWYSVIPNYEKATEYNGSLFLYDDGGLGIPPFFVEKEEANSNENPDTSGGSNNSDNSGTSGSTGSQTGSNQGGDSSGTEPTIHVVKPGETVFSISMKYYGSGAFVDDIMALNNILDPSTLQSGATLKLPLYTK